MGACCVRDEQTRQIENKMSGDRHVENLRKKLLLLGSGASGKSTVFKQIRRINGVSIAVGELNESLHVIRSNLVQGMLLLLQQSTKFFEMDNEKFSHFKVNMEDEEIANSIQEIIQHYDKNFQDPTEEMNDLSTLGKALKMLWQAPSIQAVFQKREGLFSFPDNMDYFFGKCEEIMSANYTPNHEDTLKVRIRTTGIINYEYNTDEGISMLIIDVGGQRNERKKWIHSFDNVTAIIYVIALNHYATVLFEDEQKNAMHEALELFDEIRNSKWFKKNDIILFLNKNDLFQMCLRYTSLNFCFSHEKNWHGRQWNGHDYIKNNNANNEEDEANFALCYQEAISFIRDVFVDMAKSPESKARIYPHVICATDQDNIQIVFRHVQQGIIIGNLQSGGLIL